MLNIVKYFYHQQRSATRYSATVQNLTIQSQKIFFIRMAHGDSPPVPPNGTDPNSALLINVDLPCRLFQNKWILVQSQGN